MLNVFPSTNGDDTPSPPTTDQLATNTKLEGLSDAVMDLERRFAMLEDSSEDPPPPIIVAKAPVFAAPPPTSASTWATTAAAMIKTMELRNQCCSTWVALKESMQT